ncbi:MAG TPA: energy transducer TonB, partial [Blastocatellia bacterium]|nr:energy transducer TonB [Blastocatellia bacterium]
RIKLMLNANHQSKSSTASRALAGITFVALIALAAAMALFSRGGAAEAEAQNAQDQKYVATAPMRFENLPEIPLVITEARLSVGEARVMTDGGVDPDRRTSHRAVRGEMARDVELVAGLVNQSDRRVTELMVEIQNPSFWANEPVNIISKPSANSDAPGKQRVVDPQGSFTFETELPLQEKIGGLDLMNHLYDFNIRVIGVKFESDEYWLMAQPGKTPSTARVKMSFNSTDNEAPREVVGRKKDSAAGQVQGATDSIQPMSRSMRPTILYKEKAEYTLEARNKKIEGTVVLNVVFGVGGQISDIRVIRGLPHGLTENAIIAAKKIRFEPAMKDGQPVSVRGKLEFTFNLNKDPIQDMSSSMRPTILYREKAQYTQEAKDNKVEGTVILRVVFGADGQISDIRVIRGLPHGLTEKAIEAANKIRFEPAMKDGRPVSVRGELEYNFRL